MSRSPGPIRLPDCIHVGRVGNDIVQCFLNQSSIIFFIDFELWKHFIALSMYAVGLTWAGGLFSLASQGASDRRFLGALERERQFNLKNVRFNFFSRI